MFVRNQACKLGAAVSGARKQQNITQSQLAEQLHVTIPTIRKLESGDASVSLQTCLAALLILKIEKDILQTQVKDIQTLPKIETNQKTHFAKRLQLQGINSTDAENSAWILSLTPEQRIHMLINQEKEQVLCGIARL